MLSNDNSGKHPHIVKESCESKDCDNKVCSTVCDNNNQFSVLGHNTHKPLIGRFSKFISDYDANGEPDVQYFTKTNQPKTITGEEKKNLEKLIKNDTENQKTFVFKHRDKYDDK